MWKIIDSRVKKRFYYSKFSFQQFWKYHHKKYQRQVQRWPNRLYSMQGYMLVCVDNNTQKWELIREAKNP